MTLVARNRTIQKVSPRIVDIPNLLVSDVANKRRFVEQRQDELRIVNVERAQK